MDAIILFIFGLAIGSFLNVVAMRYDGERFLFDTNAIGGRSHCPHCKKTLRWFELIPLFSFLLQAGKCRRCKTSISMQYPIVEFISGLIFVFVPYRSEMLLGVNGLFFIGFVAFWILFFEALLVMSLIDIHLGIIPDELNIFLLVLAIFFGIFITGYAGTASHSLLGSYANVFGLQQSFWLNRFVGLLFGGIFFGALIAITRGRGMGMGDLKLAIPLGFFFGWPDILVVTGFSFVIGATIGVLSIIFGKKKMSGSLPFGPFFALGAVVVFFFGAQLFHYYFSLMGLG